MPLVKRIRSRGANIVVTAEAENLFLPGAPATNFTRNLSTRVRAATARHAPSNKRPRWAHYGLPLKKTMRASSMSRPSEAKAYFAVGSTAGHALFVDQGTGIYNPEGGAPYEAKILPPTAVGSPSLYERTWRHPSGKRQVDVVMIDGQKGQGFFDKGLRDGLAAMRVASGQVPFSKADAGMRTFPDRLENFVGATPADAAFRAQLEEWRKWRDQHFKMGGYLGNEQARDRYINKRRSEGIYRAGRSFKKRKPARTTAERQAVDRERKRKARATTAKAKGRANKRPQNTTAVRGYPTVKAKKDAAVKVFLAQNPQFRGRLRRTPGGIVVPGPGGRPIPIGWERLFALL